MSGSLPTPQQAGLSEKATEAAKPAVMQAMQQKEEEALQSRRGKGGVSMLSYQCYSLCSGIA